VFCCNLQVAIFNEPLGEPGGQLVADYQLQASRAAALKPGAASLGMLLQYAAPANELLQWACTGWQALSLRRLERQPKMSCPKPRGRANALG